MPDYIEGKRPLIEALRSSVPLQSIFVANTKQSDRSIETIMQMAQQQGVLVKTVSVERLDRLSVRGNHQGVIAEAKPYCYADIDDVIARANKYARVHDGRALVVILDHLTDTGNFGAIIRSAESVGAQGVIIPNKRSVRVDAVTYKSSAGAVAHVPVVQTANISRAIVHLQESGFWIIGASEQATDDVWSLNLKGKYALVMGNEHKGISRVVLKACDFIGRLPQQGELSSLNVAQAATVFMYEWLRQNTSTPA